jgi:hypothetical protein
MDYFNRNQSSLKLTLKTNDGFSELSAGERGAAI